MTWDLDIGMLWGKVRVAVSSRGCDVINDFHGPALRVQCFHFLRYRRANLRHQLSLTLRRSSSMKCCYELPQGRPTVRALATLVAPRYERALFVPVLMD